MDREIELVKSDLVSLLDSGKQNKFFEAVFKLERGARGVVRTFATTLETTLIIVVACAVALLYIDYR